jgi:DNA-binding NtrC family response regulator
MTKHILTIDDEAPILDLLREALTAAGYRVTGVSTLAEALRVVQDDSPNLILTDLQLEDTDGFEVIDQLKEVAPAIPVILLTGMLFDADVIRGPIGKKIAAYVEKTASLARILGEVKRHLPS